MLVYISFSIIEIAYANFALLEISGKFNIELDEGEIRSLSFAKVGVEPH